MKNELFGIATCLGMPVFYYLLSDSGGYGIGVEYQGETVLLRRLSRIRSEVEALLTDMRQGSVTPVTARDVAEDWFSQGNPCFF